MSERRASYDTMFDAWIDQAQQREAWDSVGRQIETSLDVEIAASEAEETVQRAVDLLTLAEWVTPRRGLRVCRAGGFTRVALDDGDIGATRVFYGERAVAEAAAFVRGRG